MKDIFINADIRLEQDPQFCQPLEPVEKRIILARANTMLDIIKESLSEFYVTKPPINRRERRERAKQIKTKILEFNAYCKRNGLRVKKFSQ